MAQVDEDVKVTKQYPCIQFERNGSDTFKEWLCMDMKKLKQKVTRQTYFYHVETKIKGYVHMSNFWNSSRPGLTNYKI